MLKPQPRPHGLDALEKIHKENLDRISKALERADSQKRKASLGLDKAKRKERSRGILSWLLGKNETLD